MIFVGEVPGDGVRSGRGFGVLILITPSNSSVASSSTMDETTVRCNRMPR
jgi:hypothetical protein